jgi:hypothetical protein
MSHERSDSIRLLGDMARCEPSGPCTMRTKCARYMAALPKFGGSMADYAIATGGGTALCVGYINVTTLHALPEQKPAPVVRPSVRGIG